MLDLQLRLPFVLLLPLNRISLLVVDFQICELSLSLLRYFQTLIVAVRSEACRALSFVLVQFLALFEHDPVSHVARVKLADLGTALCGPRLRLAHNSSSQDDLIVLGGPVHGVLCHRRRHVCL